MLVSARCSAGCSHLPLFQSRYSCSRWLPHSLLVSAAAAVRVAVLGWRRTYVLAFRHQDTIALERRAGFTHSHNDTVNWSHAQHTSHSNSRSK